MILICLSWTNRNTQDLTPHVVRTHVIPKSLLLPKTRTTAVDLTIDGNRQSQSRSSLNTIIRIISNNPVSASWGAFRVR